ncbi:MAG: hypothetical protein GXO62_08805 [Epsilonproteobacteria bacterium]|nr:hypothetical protein [Campylobacterota bacterium]
MFYLPSKEECDYIVEHSKQFFKKSFEFLGKNVSVYHYKQGNFEEFKKFNAWELRALTFVEDKRFLGIHKFFELNQAPGWMEEDLRGLKIIKAQEKIDGTLMQPVMIDNEIYFKSKLRFDSIQALKANEILKKSPNLKEYILKKYSENKIPLFEYISEESQIVMDYQKETLILIQVRDLKTGEYDLEFEKEARDLGIECARVCESRNFEEYLEMREDCSDKEGWVLIFENMKFVKVKTSEYLKRHLLLGKIQPHNVIQKALKGEINQYFNILNQKSQKFKEVNDIYQNFEKKRKALKNIIKSSFNFTKAQLQQKYGTHPYYEAIAFSHKRKDIKALDEWLEKNVKKLKHAKRFLDEDIRST